VLTLGIEASPTAHLRKAIRWNAWSLTLVASAARLIKAWRDRAAANIVAPLIVNVTLKNLRRNRKTCQKARHDDYYANHEFAHVAILTCLFQKHNNFFTFFNVQGHVLPNTK
jgi:hypothetical protein